MADNYETEFTLSTGKLLAFFFGMVVICGIFFSLGYGVGRNSSSAASTTVLDSSSLSTVPNSGAAKPSARKPVSSAEMTALKDAAQQNEQKPCTPGDASCTMPSADAASTSAQAHKAASPRVTSPNAAAADSAKTSESSKSNSAAAMKTPELASGAQPGAGFMVQVAAVSKQEDADALVNALRKKQYPVFVVNQASSNLFHVQVGPFLQQKDAETMRAKLVGDGYNAILKR